LARMSPLRLSRLVLPVIVLAAAGAMALSSSAAPGGASQAPAKISPERVDGVHLGDTHQDLRNRGKVGPIQPGCELGGPNTRSANLRPPLKGFVTYSLSSPRRVRAITVRGGARARGVGIGAKIPAILARFPNATVDHSTDQVFQLTLVMTPKRKNGHRIMFGVSTKTDRTTVIGVPGIAFCE
jgi:hypothetical protein